MVVRKDVVRVSVYMVRIRIERVYIVEFGHSCETPPSMKVMFVRRSR